MSEWVAYTYAFGHYLPLAERALKSFARFHPEIPIFFFTPDSFSLSLKNLITRKVSTYDISQECINAGKLLNKEFKNIIYFDADTLIASRFEEVLSEKESVLMLSLSEEHKRAKTVDERLDGNRFPNRGFFAIHELDFFEEYGKEFERRLNIDKEWADNDALALMQFKFPFFFLEERFQVYYNERGRKFWQEKGKVRLENGELVCEDGRKLRILHWAGGWKRGEKFRLKKEHKLSPEIVEFLGFLE